MPTGHASRIGAGTGPWPKSVLGVKTTAYKRKYALHYSSNLLDTYFLQ